MNIPENYTFEKALRELEKIVQELETEEFPLETAIEKFEEGIQLSKYCSTKLDETERRIAILLKGKNGRIVEKPFKPGDTY
jgi:exodeoxyribonuclease VII small subunit